MVQQNEIRFGMLQTSLFWMTASCMCNLYKIHSSQLVLVTQKYLHNAQNGFMALDVQSLHEKEVTRKVSMIKSCGQQTQMCPLGYHHTGCVATSKLRHTMLTLFVVKKGREFKLVQMT